MTKKTYHSLDWFRMICAFLVIAIHTSVLSSFSETADFFVTGVLCRVAVPFFFMVSGFFLMPKVSRHFKTVIKIEKKFLCLYLIAILLYLPLNFYAGQYFFSDPSSLCRALFLDGTFYHLWYFPAVIEGIFLLALMQCFFSKRVCMVICILLYLIGLGGDSYYGVVKNSDFLRVFYDIYFQIGTYTRNGFFFAPVFLCLGWRLSDHEQPINVQTSFAIFLLSFLSMMAEGGILHSFALQRHDSMYLFLLPCMYGLFCFLLCLSEEDCFFTKNRKNHFSSKNTDSFRKISMILYLIHPWIIVLVRTFSRILHLEVIFVRNSLFHYIIVCCISYSLAVILWKIQNLWKIQKKI